MGNPFEEASEDLLVLDTKDIVDSSVAETISQIQNIGQQQYEQFVDERLKKRTKALSDTIKHNKNHLFGTQPVRKVSKEKQQISNLKHNCALFSKLYISCQVRNGNLDEFFKHENQPCPPSLSIQGKLRHGTKSDLIACLDKGNSTKEQPAVEAVVLDGAAVINMLKPGASNVFYDYWEHVYKPYLERTLHEVKRLDIVWDVYLSNSLKATERSNRGKGIRRRVLPNTSIPGNWESFLRNDQNKTELFQYLGEMTVTLECDKIVVSTKGNIAICNDQTKTVDRISPCEHEEADTRLLLHVADMGEEGVKKVMIRTVDTDVVVIAVAQFQNSNIDELWISFGAGKNYRYIPIHEIAQSLGPEKSSALPFFHAVTGCDQTSAFANKGKKTAWETWNVFDDVTPYFHELSNMPTENTLSTAMPFVEHFVVLVYDRASTCLSVDEARRDMFTRKGRAIDASPPTSAALLQHVRRSVYQAGFCWGQTLVANPVLPNPSSWGWQLSQEQEWEPLWTTLPQASESCLEFLKCGCKIESGCRGRCKCVGANVLCTALCKCGGDCDRA